MGKWYNSDALYINSKTVVSAFHKSAKTKEIVYCRCFLWDAIVSISRFPTIFWVGKIWQIVDNLINNVQSLVVFEKAES